MFFAMLLLYIRILYSSKLAWEECRALFEQLLSQDVITIHMENSFAPICASYIMVASIGHAMSPKEHDPYVIQLRKYMDWAHQMLCWKPRASGAWVIILTRMAVSWQLPDLCKTFVSGWLNDTHTYNIHIYIYIIL